MVDINNFTEGTTFEYEGKIIEIHYDVRSLVGIDIEERECCELCYHGPTGHCTKTLTAIHGADRDACSSTNNKGFRFYYRLKEVDNVESNGQDAGSKDRVD